MGRKNQLLVMPRFVNKVGEWYNFPLGLPYVSASLKKEGFNVYTLNLNNVEDPIKDILEREIEEKDIDIVATGGLTYQYYLIRAIVEAVKSINEDIVTIVGGGIITSAPKVAMEALEYADYGVIGEGEITTCELAYALEDNEDVEEVDGIIYKKNDGYHITNSRQEIHDLDSIPFPDYEGFGFGKIMDLVASYEGINEKNVVTMLSSRSCPFQCTFCFKSSGSKYRKRSLNNFFKELDYLVDKYNVKYIFIADELFSYNKERLKNFCHRIKDYDIKWWAQFRVSDVNRELVKTLKDSNCEIMSFGLESADDRILESMNKNITIEEIENALEIVYEEGITIQGNFIFGDVEETLETATNTLEWWKEHRHYGINLKFITVYPGTELYEYACEQGVIEDEVQYIKEGCLSINVSKMSEEERAWLAKQMAVLAEEEPNNLKDIEIDYENEVFSLKGECVACNNKNHWEDIKLFTSNVLTCNECGHRHSKPALDEITNIIDNNIENLLKEYDKIAFWGINNYFSNFSRHLNSTDNDNIYYIDATKMKQGSKIDGKVIHSPETVREQNIELVVVPILSIVNIIEKQVESDFENVEVVIDILDLLRRG
ncbi:B12-binding domain-containing radical SAM protein [Halanaerobacter jeridensis]|uniref:Radical SAM superfamily enzyme YgiQ (UPF0313 family) n=1 Tax=Halanaerobacter jeridensis TaxID=706427 RepID=A0A938XTK3_9FIRM|nr:radical SAM protein [Halanaerobacter jeridensis]MBM7557275.1 radical SAM superfamily enzyme YgiQ (UPF0313 family) [Halanaerobacter jeridensis]